jgi:hypothetical protein
VVNTTPRTLYPRERPGTHCTLYRDQGKKKGLTPTRSVLLAFGKKLLAKHDYDCVKFASEWKEGRHGFMISLLLQNKYKEYSRDREAEETVDDLQHNVVSTYYVTCGHGANYLFV